MNGYSFKTKRHTPSRSHRFYNSATLPNISLAVSLASLSCPVVAQSEASETSMRVLEEIVVTARRREESL